MGWAEVTGVWGVLRVSLLDSCGRRCHAHARGTLPAQVDSLLQVSLLDSCGCGDLVARFARHLSAGLQHLVAAACVRRGLRAS